VIQQAITGTLIVVLGVFNQWNAYTVHELPSSILNRPDKKLSTDVVGTALDGSASQNKLRSSILDHPNKALTDVVGNNDPPLLSWHKKEQPILYEFPPVQRRLDFLHHLEKVPSFQTGVEVGVQKGILAKKSLDIWQSCTEYILVDLWGKEEGYNEPGADTTADKDQNLREARRRMKKWEASNKVKFMVTRSTDAANQLPDGHFDYIYLDARHDYCAVKEDIVSYYPKIRPGGILGGHDYIDAQYAIDRLGTVEDWSKCEDGSIHPEAVKGAVDEFRQQHGGLSVYVSNVDFPSWYIQKPY